MQGYGIRRGDIGRTCRCCPAKYRGRKEDKRGAKKRARRLGKEPR